MLAVLFSTISAKKELDEDEDPEVILKTVEQLGLMGDFQSEAFV